MTLFEFFIFQKNFKNSTPSKNFTRVIMRKILKFLKLIREELMSLVYRMHFSQEYNAGHFLTRIYVVITRGCSNNARYLLLLLSQSLLAELHPRVKVKYTRMP